MIQSVSEVPSTTQKEPVLNFSPSLPQPASTRISSLDIIRGVAVLAAMFTSIWVFGGFSENEQTNLLLRSKGWNYRLFGTVDLLLNGKMQALIAIVFGAGMMIFMTKENSGGQAGNADLFIRRQLWLILFGILNAVIFLWSGDIVFHLGIMGILLFPFIRISKKALLIAAAAAMLIFCGKNYWNYSDDKKAYKKYLAVVAFEKKLSKDSADKKKADSLTATLQGGALIKDAKKDTVAKSPTGDTLTKEQKQDKGAWEGRIAGMKYDPKKDDGSKKSMRRTSYAKIWNHLLPATQQKEAQWTYQTGVWELAAMILLGMALLKFGFFNSRFSQGWYFLIAVTGIVIGLMLGWFRLHNYQFTLQDYAKYIDHHSVPNNLFFPIEIAAMATGYTSLLIFLSGTGIFKASWQALGSVGKMALTTYLLQSIICTWFFTGFGMGYFGRLTHVQLYIAAAEICLLQIAFSLLWLRRYEFGPAEWLLRCMVYKTWLPNKIQKSPTIDPSVVNPS